MGYIEDLAARDAARQNVEAAKRVEAAKILNQDGLAVQSVVNTPYAGGITAEDNYKLQLIKDAQKANEYNRAMDMIDKNRGYQDALRNVEAGSGWGDRPADINPKDMAIIKDYRNGVDPGLAAKWMADRDSFK